MSNALNAAGGGASSSRPEVSTDSANVGPGKHGVGVGRAG